MILLLILLGAVWAALIIIFLIRIHSSKKKIGEADERLQLMLDAAPMCCELWNKDQKVLACNEEAVRLFESSSRQEFCERFFDLCPERQPCGRLSSEMAAEAISKAFDTGFQRFEWVHRKLNGELIPSEVTLVRIKYKGEYVLVGYILDLREHYRMLDELRLARDAAEKASSAKSSFLANTSHEMRTPMNAILGITEILLSDKTLSTGIREALNKIYNSGDLLLGIVNDILDLSKIEAGKLELSPAPYQVASLINDTVALNMLRIGSKPVEFRLSVDKDIPSTLIGDELRIKQILNNLLSNSIKYTIKGTVKLSVSVATESEDKKTESPVSGKGSETTIIFTVCDTGQGMTEDQVEKIFDKFSRFNKEVNLAIEGTGLGMDITHNLVKMMNGKISVDSKVNMGTVFTVHLPQERAGSEVLGLEVAQSLQNFELYDAKQLRRAQIVYESMPYGSVLIVDDVETNLYVAKGLLTPYGLSIDTAGSGYEAIEKIRNGKVYDIVFMDHMMPKMDGMEATGEIRKLGYTHPVIALTANAVAGQADVFLANGFDGFISKPIDIRKLNEVLKKFVRCRQVIKTGEATQQSIDPQLAGFFVRDATKAISALEQILQKNGVYEDEDIALYTINVHGMKSCLANIGENELSALAAKLEKAGKDLDFALIENETPAFLGKLQSIIGKLTSPKKAGENGDALNADPAYLREKFMVIMEACEEYDRNTVKAVLAELEPKKWPSALKESIDIMTEQLLIGDFDGVSATAKTIIDMTL